MLSREDNELLTQVGPGTPGGELLRRYWMPVCALADFPKDEPKKRIRMLGEDLVLFRDASGNYGLIPEQCPHRRASLYNGFIEKDGLRCPYHGWKFAANGACIEQPFEGNNPTLRKQAGRRSYPIQQMCGLLFTYMGPDPVPLLPRWETAIRRDGTRSIVQLPLHNNNWLQAMENSCDPTHTYYLHGEMMLHKRSAEENAKSHDVAYFHRPIEAFDFELCIEPGWAGIRKMRTYGGERPEKEVGHPVVFPNILIAPQGKSLCMHFRVPVDDTHTNIWFMEFWPNADGSISDQRDEDIPVEHVKHPMGPDGEYELTTFIAQDLMAWETQGPVCDRTQELTGVSDRGIYMFRNLLRQQIQAVQAGKDPVGVVRDPKINEIIRFTFSEGQAKIARAMEAAAE
jgi:5,5'-dehydrodivanillate O-demethylase oxygenase subunit